MSTTTRSRTTAQKHSSVLERDPGLEALGAGIAPAADPLDRRPLASELIDEAVESAAGRRRLRQALGVPSDKRISNQVIDELLDGASTEEEIAGPGGLLAQLTRRLVERALEVELTDHVGYEPHQEPPGGGGNTRNARPRWRPWRDRAWLCRPKTSILATARRILTLPASPRLKWMSKPASTTFSISWPMPMLARGCIRLRSVVKSSADRHWVSPTPSARSGCTTRIMASLWQSASTRTGPPLSWMCLTICSGKRSTFPILRHRLARVALASRPSAVVVPQFSTLLQTRWATKYSGAHL